MHFLVIKMVSFLLCYLHHHKANLNVAVMYLRTILPDFYKTFTFSCTHTHRTRGTTSGSSVLPLGLEREVSRQTFCSSAMSESCMSRLQAVPETAVSTPGTGEGTDASKGLAWYQVVYLFLVTL